MTTIDDAITEAIHALLRAAVPGNTLTALHQSEGDHFNTAYIVDIRSADDALRRLIIKRYEECGEDRGEKARREYTALTWLQRSGVSAPQPVFVDERGKFLGAPALVSTLIDGAQIWQPNEPSVDPQQWMREMATTLAQIHRTPCDPAARRFLRDGAATSLWMLGEGTLPAPMKNHPTGEAVWNAIVAQLPHLELVEPCLVHIDYWRGNLLWHQGRVVAVIDWEEASLGDPAEDVAYCRMDLWSSVSEDLADEFLRAYEEANGGPVANLGFWELVAAARPIWQVEGWHVTPGEKERFQRFVTNALKRTVRV